MEYMATLGMRSHRGSVSVSDDHTNKGGMQVKRVTLATQDHHREERG